MQQRKRKVRAVLVGGVAVIAILTCSIVVGWWKWAADQEDMRTTIRLRGRWEVHLAAAPDNARPEQIYEFLPDGRLAIYGSDSNLLNDKNIHWSIRDGDLLWQITAHIPKDINNFIPEDVHVNETSRLQLQWDDEDTIKVPGLVLRRRSKN